MRTIENGKLQNYNSSLAIKLTKANSFVGDTLWSGFVISHYSCITTPLHINCMPPGQDGCEVVLLIGIAKVSGTFLKHLATMCRREEASSREGLGKQCPHYLRSSRNRSLRRFQEGIRRNLEGKIQRQNLKPLVSINDVTVKRK